jgi:hypothetical protein
VSPPAKVPLLESETGAMGVFIPSFVENNGILLARNPGYVTRFKSVGSLSTMYPTAITTQRERRLRWSWGQAAWTVHYTKGGAARTALVSHEVAKRLNDAYRSQKFVETNGHLGNAG